MTKKILITSFLVGLVLTTSGFSCTLLQKSTRGAKGDPNQKVELQYWRVFDGEDTMRPTIDAYNQLHPNVTIKYKMFRFEEYEQELLDALAEDRGPDIFTIHNTWVDKYQTKIQPMPKTLQIGYLVRKGSSKKVTGTEIRTIAGWNTKKIKDDFVDTVSADVIRGTPEKPEIDGIPLYVDTMALYYNKDYFNAAGIVTPPKDWSEFRDAVLKLTRINQDTEDIEQSGAAFGAAKNVERASDLLSTLMMQSGARMTQGSAVTFPDNAGKGEAPPAIDALRFYSDFAATTPRKEVYTWNEDQPSSFEAFSQGRTAMFFGYSYHQDLLKLRAPQLRYAVAPLPQIDRNHPFAPANYWLETISKKTKNTDWAWDFIMFASQEKQVKSYLDKTKKPTALRSLIPAELTTEELGPFAAQLLFAQNWYHGHDPLGAEKAFLAMMTEALGSKGGTIQEERQKLRDTMEKARQIIQAAY